MSEYSRLIGDLRDSGSLSEVEQWEARIEAADVIEALMAERDTLIAQLATARSDALEEAAQMVDKFLLEQGGSKGGTKTPQGRTAFWFKRKLCERIRALKETTPQEKK